MARNWKATVELECSCPLCSFGWGVDRELVAKVNLASFWQVQASKLFKTNFCSFFGILAQGWQVCFSEMEGEGTEEMSACKGCLALPWEV